MNLSDEKTKQAFQRLEPNRPETEYQLEPEPRTFEMWLYYPTGRMYPFVEGEKQCIENDEWGRITVQEVEK